MIAAAARGQLSGVSNRVEIKTLSAKNRPPTAAAIPKTVGCATNASEAGRWMKAKR